MYLGGVTVLHPFQIYDVLESFWYFKIYNILIFYISFSFIENCVTNDIL